MQEIFQSEHVYALRRILVGRLQAASRGASRRARFQLHQDFIREWEECRRQGRLGALGEALDVPEAGEPGEELLFRLARGRAASPEHLAGERPKLAFSLSESRATVSRTPATPLQTLARDDGWMGLQEELFGPELALHPL